MKEFLARQRRIFALIPTVFLFVGFSAVMARGQTPDDRWSPDIYKHMVDADSSATIPLGTKITLQNWKKYREFMPYWMQVAYAGNFHFKVGPKPEYTVDVEATQNYPLPRKWREDGEKYGSQTTLEKDENGGWVMKGWVAGPPFPHPSGPNRGIEDVYNVWCSFRPFLLYIDTTGFLIDRFARSKTSISKTNWPRLALTLPAPKRIWPTPKEPCGATGSFSPAR